MQGILDDSESCVAGDLRGYGLPGHQRRRAVEDDWNNQRYNSRVDGAMGLILVDSDSQ